jgi:hypothetical protein
MILSYEASSIGFIAGTTGSASARMRMLQAITGAHSELFLHKSIAWASGEGMGA